MTRYLLFGLVTLAGIAAGTSLTWWELSGDEVAIRATVTPRGAAKPGENPSIVGTDPKVKVEGGENHDFGTMHKGEKRRHTFVIQNIGSAPLTLVQGRTTCVCTISKVSEGSIDPGKSASVTLEWHPESYAEEFRQTADIITNDPDRKLVTLGVHGRVTSVVRPMPEDITFGRIAASETHKGEVMFYAFQDRPLQAGPPELLNPAGKDYFDVSLIPLTPEELLAEKGAKSGLKLLIRLKPGLPLGPMEQKIRVTTNYPEVQPFDIPVRGTMVSDISFAAAAKLDAERNLLTLGTIEGAAGLKSEVKIAVKGPHADKVEFKVGEVFPEGILKVTLGKPYGKRPILVPMTIEIPPGSPAAVHTGGQDKFGKIVLETTHPDAKQVVLHVQFIVQ